MATESKKTIEEAAALLKDVMPILEKFAEAEAPSEKDTVAQPEASKFSYGDDAYGKMLELRATLIRQNQATLERMIDQQLAKGSREGIGVPLSKWAQGDRAVYQAMAADPTLTKLLDTGSGGALIRQDLEPLLYAAFVQRFPLWDRFRKVPSNGLVHAFNRHDAVPDASFIAELGTVPSGTGTYTRATTNIAIAAIQVGTSLKNQFAAGAASGAGWNPETEEISGGLTGLRRKLQRTLFSGNASVPAGTATSPEGLYDANAFDGLRGTIPSGTTRQKQSGETLEEALNLTDALLSVTGGQASIVVMDARDRIQWMNDQIGKQRIAIPMASVIPGMPQIEAVSLGNSGTVPVLGIPGDEVGHYTDGVDVRDAYLIDESGIAIPYLGSEMPTVLEIPVGVSGQLTRVYILFQMCGLAVRVPNFQAKLQIPQ